MEAYFHSDPRIEEWINQITEKLFTVCLLTGVDAEAEFHRGCQIVAKLAHLLQGISIFPSEYLEDGVRQLVEQQLPDSRVINNFSTFQKTMHRMLQEGMTRAIDPQSKESFKTLATSEFITELVVPALASVNIPCRNLLEVDNEIASSRVPSLSTKPYGIIRKTQVPEQADRLRQVLSHIFPNVTVCWNLNLMGQTFLAQVEDILIYLNNPERPCHVENFNREGWKVYICSSNDLIFPRRLERGIRHIQRIGKQCENG